MQPRKLFQKYETDTKVSTICTGKFKKDDLWAPKRILYYIKEYKTSNSDVLTVRELLAH